MKTNDSKFQKKLHKKNCRELGQLRLLSSFLLFNSVFLFSSNIFLLLGKIKRKTFYLFIYLMKFSRNEKRERRSQSDFKSKNKWDEEMRSFAGNIRSDEFRISYISSYFIAGNPLMIITFSCLWYASHIVRVSPEFLLKSFPVLFSPSLFKVYFLFPPLIAWVQT